MVLTDYSRSWKHDDPQMKIEYGPLDIAWKLVRYAGIDISRATFFAISGFSSIFLYNKDSFWVYDALRQHAIAKSIDLSGAVAEQYVPKDLDEALQAINYNLGRAFPVYASWFDPILIYGLEGSLERPSLKWHNNAFAPEGLSWSREDMEKNWWNWAKDPSGNSLLVIKKKNDFELTKELIMGVLQEFVDSMNASKEADENGTFAGLTALHAYATDLRDAEIDFTILEQEKQLNRLAWFDSAIYCQWTQFIAMRDFLIEAQAFMIETQSSFDNGSIEQLKSVIDRLSESVYHWSEWEGKIGRLQDQELFVRRIADIQIRSHAAESVDRSIFALGDAVNTLIKLVK